MSLEMTQSSGIRTTLISLALVVGLGCNGERAPDAQMTETEVTRLALAGTKLSAEEAQRLEQDLEQKPRDLTARVKLLGYYSRRQFESSEDRATRQRHVLWIIGNVPESEVAGTPFALLDQVLDADAFQQGKTLWIEKSRGGVSAEILGNSANFFSLHEPERSLELLKRAQRLEPKNPEWPRSRGSLHFRLMSFSEEGPERVRLARQALDQFEKARSIKDKPNAHEDEFLLQYAAEAAYEAGDSDKATLFANQLLETHASSREGGNAIHYGNLVLGRVALRSGNLEDAKRYLIDSGKTPGSPNLNSFGPRMRLARDLLLRGERDAVLEYLDLCAVFWQSHQSKLTEWQTEIMKGNVPDFGANLHY